MKHQYSFHFYSFILICLFISCEDDSNTQPILGLSTTVEVIANSEDHTILNSLLQENGLVEFLDEGTFTIFAPVDAAFENVDISSLSPEEIRNLLLYHVIAGNATSADFSNTYLDTQATVTINERESNLSLFVNVADNIFLNENALILETDLNASNGTIHSIDQLIQIPNLSTFVNIDPNFEFLLAALSREDQPDYLATLATNLEDDPAPISLFAPSNEAFTAALGLLGLEDLAEIEADFLTEILNLHLVANANLREIDFTEINIQTLGGNLEYNLEDNVIIDANGREIEFTTRNVQTINGILHVLSDVILPETELQEPPEPINQITFTLDNEGTTAYFVSEINGNELVTNVNENNSTFTFTVGTRYSINVVNAENHPLEFKNLDQDVLLSQAVEGSFASDPDVDFTIENTIFSFTLTQDLADKVSSYNCSNHPNMTGDILVN
jgi:transforming growth factor-beta-induced protein